MSLSTLKDYIYKCVHVSFFLYYLEKGKKKIHYNIFHKDNEKRGVICLTVLHISKKFCLLYTLSSFEISTLESTDVNNSYWENKSRSYFRSLCLNIPHLRRQFVIIWGEKEWFCVIIVENLKIDVRRKR